MVYLLKLLAVTDVERVDTLDDFLEHSEHYILGSLRAIEVQREHHSSSAASPTTTTSLVFARPPSLSLSFRAAH